MNVFNKIILKYYIKLHDYLYTRISKIATKMNNNVHPKHEIMKYYDFFIENINEDSNVLDLGCGIGYLTYKISKRVKKIIGVDIDKKSIDIAKKKFSKPNITYIHANILDYDFDEKFDYIILSNVLEHIKNRIELLLRLKKYTNYLIIRVPMIDRSWLVLYQKNLGIDYRLDKSHYIEYTFESFRSEMEKINLKIVNYQIKFGEIWAKVKT